MAETFDLPVWYNGEELFFPAELQTLGYTHKIRVTIEGVNFVFEPDDEKNYRALLADTDHNKPSSVDTSLLQAIAETLHELFS
ncbi:MAG: hypothetical protein V4450_15355 [Bacteroidota bacterium]